MYLLTVLLTVSVIINILLALFLSTASSRLLQFDNLFQKVLDDVDVFEEYLAELEKKSSFSQSPDVIKLNHGISSMRDRFNSYILTFKSMSLTPKPKSKKKDKLPSPVVVD